MSFTASAVKTAYETYRTAASGLADAQTTLAGLGARPAFPVKVTIDQDYNTVETAQATYDASYATALAAVNAAQQTLKGAELAIFGIAPANIWIHITNADDEDVEEEDIYDVNIGYDLRQRILNVTTTAVTKAFPEIA